MRTESGEAQRLRRLIELGPSLISEPDLDTLLGRLLDTAREVTGARFAALRVLDSGRNELGHFLSSGLSQHEAAAIGAPPRGQGVLGLVEASGQPLRITELSTHPSSAGVPAGHPGMTSFLGVPILIRDQVWGTLYLTEKVGGDFDDTDEEAAVTLAAWTAIAVEHARLLAAAGARQGTLERAVRGLEATQAIAVAVGAETDPGRVLELIADRGRAIVRARSVVILLKDGEDLVVEAAAGQSPPQLGARLPIAESSAGEVMLRLEPSRVTNVDWQLRILPHTFGGLEAHSALLVPLGYRGRPLGVLVAFDRGQGALTFTPEDEQVLLAFAASAATAVATAQAVEADRLRHTLDAAESERRYWARELHDETLQALGGMKVLASAACRESDPAPMLAALNGLVSGLESQIHSVHAIISELRPAALDDLGLRPAIETLAERHRVIHGAEIACELDLPNPDQRDRRLAPELEITAYRVVQEALTNVVRHADAKRVRIEVSAAGGRLSLQVIDDGHGFVNSASAAGFGLTGMHERVALAGGALEITSGPGGTAVRASLPARYTDARAAPAPR